MHFRQANMELFRRDCQSGPQFFETQGADTT